MQIAINGIYTLDIPRDLWNDRIAYVNKIHSPRFTWWKEINGKKVKVKSNTHLVSEFYIATLLKDFIQPFYTPKKCLSTNQLKIICECDSYKLFWCGCTCGAFQHEQDLGAPKISYSSKRKF